MARLNIAPTKSNLLVMNEQLAISQDGYELLEQKREILVMELMRMVEQVKLLEQRINAQVEKAFPALRKMLLVTGVDTVERLSQAVQYDFQIHEKEMSAGGMSFSSVSVALPKRELFYSFVDSFAETDAVMAEFFELLKLL